MAFHVGLIGRGDLSGADIVALGSAATGLLLSIAAAVAKTHAEDQAAKAPAFLGETPRLRCLSALAGDGDRLLARAGLNAGWVLVAALPCSPNAFEAELREGSEADGVRRLLAEASIVCEFDGGSQPSAEVDDYLIEHADLIVAIGDDQSPGGAGDALRRAIARGKPVIVIPPASPKSIDGREDLRSIVGSILAPPNSAGFPQTYFKEHRGDAQWAVNLVKAYERLASLRIGSADPAQDDKAEGAAVASPAPEIDDALRSHFDRADRLAIAYAARYRAAGLLRYGLILPATLSSLIASVGDHPLQIAGNSAQFVVLIFLVAFSSRYWQEPTHQRFVAYRALAEQLRTQRMLAPLSAQVVKAPDKDWTNWLARALVRAAGPRSVAFDPASTEAAAQFLRSEVQAQIDFLSSRAARNELIAARLARMGIALSISGIAFSGLRAALLIANVGDQKMTLFNEAAALLPAMGPVFLGLLSFYEYRNLATRYRGIAAQMQAQLKELDAAAPGRAAVLVIARRIGDILMQEGEDWRMLIRSKTLSAY